MFFRTSQSQYNVKPERPDPVYATKLQETPGGQWGEISVMMTYLFQGWNCHAPQKYRDMILDIGTEEITHVEMLATMIARLLETSPTRSRWVRRWRNSTRPTRGFTARRSSRYRPRRAVQQDRSHCAGAFGSGVFPRPGKEW